jgi:hypothetical protein
MPTNNPRKDLRRVARLLEAQGWTVDMGHPHPRFTSPSGKRISTTDTRSGGRAWLNFMAALRRAGADLPRR